MSKIKAKSTKNHDARFKFEDQLSSTAKRKLEDHSWSPDHVKFQGLHSVDEKMKSPNPLYDSNKTSFLELKHEASTKEGSRIGDDGNTNNSSKGDERPTSHSLRPQH
ncbi:transcription factor bHLH [Forsythia ovata]|uniref:Transcription factor bHLH n=1 Tax=Forsythia ovata TaxID=205694 RepID=A0ABD1V0L5_9LAMI